MHELRQGVDVGALQLHQRAPLENQLRQLVRQREVFEHVHGGRRHLRLAGALPGGKLQLVEEDHRELLRGVDVERLAGKLEDLRAPRSQLGVDACRLACERGLIDSNAVPLDVRKHRHERKLHVAEQRLEAILAQATAQRLGELPREIGALAGEAEQRRCGQVRQRDGLLPGAADVFLRERLVAQMLERDLLDGVARPGRIEHVAREHRVELEPVEGDALVRQHHQIELQIVADLRERGVFEDRP